MTAWPDRLAFRPWRDTDADAVARWRYPGPWAVYDLRDADEPIGPNDGYTAVVSAGGGALIGFYCVGDEARVPGLQPDDAVVDVGVGLHPEWVGRGQGSEFARVVIDAIRGDHPAMPLRAVIQSWNHRPLKLAQRLGFTVCGTHRCSQDGRDVEYTVVVLSGSAV